MTDEPTNPPPDSSAGGLPPERFLRAGIPLTADAIPNVPGIAGLLTHVVTQQTHVWQSQFPPPDVLERYETLLPGAFGRMFVMAEMAQSAQIKAATDARNFQRNDVKRGQYLGFLSATIAIVAAFGCVYFKQPLAAAAFLSVPVIGVAKALVDSARAKPVAALMAPSPPEGSSDQASGTDLNPAPDPSTSHP